MSCTSIKKNYLTVPFCAGPWAIIENVANLVVILAIIKRHAPPDSERLRVGRLAAQQEHSPTS